MPLPLLWLLLLSIGHGCSSEIFPPRYDNESYGGLAAGRASMLEGLWPFGGDKKKSSTTSPGEVEKLGVFDQRFRLQVPFDYQIVRPRKRNRFKNFILLGAKCTSPLHTHYTQQNGALGLLAVSGVPGHLLQ